MQGRVLFNAALRSYRASVAQSLLHGYSRSTRNILAPSIFSRTVVASVQDIQSRTCSSAVRSPPERHKFAGFSYPGPRQLNQIVKLQLLEKHGTPRVREIWTEFHKDHKTAVGEAITAEEYNLFRQRAGRCPMFVLPIPRENGYFTLLLQFQGRHCICAYLEDYKVDPSVAKPYLTFTFFDDLAEKKSVVLIRGEITNHISVPEARKILDLIKQFYMGPRHLYDMVVAFNENSKDFDFQEILRIAEVSA